MVHTRYLAFLTAEGSVRMEIEVKSMAQTQGHTLHMMWIIQILGNCQCQIY